tara:strand:+ start:950 stop:1087 length:138 start_codon:yes stop_codon:yes gene_type:complete
MALSIENAKQNLFKIKDLTKKILLFLWFLLKIGFFDESMRITYSY